MTIGPRQVQAIFWQIFACFCAACVVVIIRYLSTMLHPLQLTFFTLVSGLLWLLPWNRDNVKLLPQKRLLGWYIARAAVSFGGTVFSYYAYRHISLPLATSLSFTIPIFAGVFAIFFFRERLDWARFIALFIAFAGVLVIARPGSEHFNLYALMMIISSAAIASSVLIIKRLTVYDAPRHIIFYSLLMMTPVSFLVSLPYWQPLEWSNLPWIIALGFFFSMQQITGARALAGADVVLIMGFDYLRLVFVAALAYLFFKDIISWGTVEGSLIILGSALFSLNRERRFTRNMPPL